MDALKNGDEIDHLKLNEPLSLAGLTEKSIHAERHKVEMRKHPEGVMLGHRGETWWIPSSAIQGAKKMKVEAKPVKQDAEK